MIKTKKSLGIIGFGKFAQFIVPYLKPQFGKITVASTSDERKAAERLGVEFNTTENAAQKDIVMLSMPTSEIGSVLEKIKECVKAKSTVIDVCSVKTYPVELMKKTIPENVNIVGTHPLFGPESGKNSIKDLKIVICPVRINSKALKKIKDIFLEMGLKTILTTAQRHDMVMANTQAVTHFFAKAIIKTIPLSNCEFYTPSAEKLFSLVNEVKNDSDQLFKDIETLNPYAKEARLKLLKNLDNINRKLNTV